MDVIALIYVKIEMVINIPKIQIRMEASQHIPYAEAVMVYRIKLVVILILIIIVF